MDWLLIGGIIALIILIVEQARKGWQDLVLWAYIVLLVALILDHVVK